MNFEPLIDGIARFIGAHGETAEKGVRVHTPTDVERWLGPLSAPEKQVPLIHDYLRGAAALGEAERTGATHVQNVDVPMWQSLQNDLETHVQADPEVQSALKNLYVNSKMPADPDVTSTIVKPRRMSELTGGAPAAAPIVAPSTNVRQPGQPANFGRTTSVEMPADTPMVPQAKAARALPKLDAVAEKQRSDAWNEFAIATESQDAVRMDTALERIKSLHEPKTVNATPGVAPGWQKALNYMRSLEEQTQRWHADGIQNDAWSRSLEKFREQSGIDAVPLPKYIRKTVDRFEAWADAQKPGSVNDRFTEALGVPRAVMSSVDLSAPGRQGILMMSRPEYWEHLKTMVDAWSPEAYHESQAYLRAHPDFQTAIESGLALTDINHKLGPQEEAFQSRMAENIPVLGNLVKSSEQAYTTFLNRVRFDVFSNTMREAAAAGVDVKNTKFLSDLAEMVNTFTGRGGGKGTNISALNTILFSPRLAMARLQTLNPLYYAQMHPYVRMQAIKTVMSSAAAIVSLVGLAGAAGAKVTWDFRNPDAGKVRIGNTRIDLGGGMFQFIRLFTQLASNQQVNSETGKVTELGSKFGIPNRLDKVTQFLISKEAPVASFVTDWLRGKDQAGKPFKLSDEVISRVTPLMMQDMYSVLQDKGIEGLLYAIPATFGIGLQTYASAPHQEVVPFLGVKGQVPIGDSQAYAKMIQQADSEATTLALARSKNLSPVAAKAVLRSYIKAGRLKARQEWIKTNVDAYRQAKLSGQSTVPLVSPGGSQ
jgi:hypothetical protein